MNMLLVIDEFRHVLISLRVRVDSCFSSFYWQCKNIVDDHCGLVYLPKHQSHHLKS